MKKLKKNNTQILADGIKNFFEIKPYKNIIDFALTEVDLSDDVSSDKNKIDLQNYNYLVEPLTHCELTKNVRKEVVINFPQQFGKTLIQNVTLLHSISYNELQSIVVYPSQELAIQTNLTKFVPLIKKLKTFDTEINMPFAVRSDRIKLSNALIYYQGAGSKIVSRSAKLVIADEASIYETPNNVNNLNELKKRTRSYNECLQLFISTPRYKEDAFWREFLGGSQGYYYLRCQHCGELTMRSCDIHNLQFETQYNEELKVYTPIIGSERLICPKCKFQHDENQKKQMIKDGAYIHNFPSKKRDYPTFQAGVLASNLSVHNWYNIATSQLEAGKTADLTDYISFDNSIRGLPFQQREYKTQDKLVLQSNYYSEIKKDELQAIYVVADTQDTFSVVGIFALDVNSNLFLLRLTRPRYLYLEDDQRAVINAENERNGKSPEQTVIDIINKQYYGLKPLCCFVDCRGHRTEQIKNFSKLQRNILLYGGTSLKYDKWKISDNNPKLFLCDAKKFQADLIFKLYDKKDKTSNSILLPNDLSDNDLEQILSVQPDKEKRNGNLFQNWSPKDKVHDCWDVLKMAIAIRDISFKIYRSDKFKLQKIKGLKEVKKHEVKKHENVLYRSKIKFY